MVQNSVTANLLRDVKRNNWLSSGRRESGLKVQILFAPHSSLRGFGHVGESLEIRACARVLRSRMEPESVSGGANLGNSPKSIRVGFGWFHPWARGISLAHSDAP